MARRLAYAIARRFRPLKPLNLVLYVLIALVPLGVDGVTQLVGLRESDPLLRTITGALFGASTAWLVLPYCEEAMSDLYRQAVRHRAHF